MNIFYLDPDPRRAARFHNDRHVVKMILESAQMLSTACRKHGINEGYKSCFEHHPCTKWASSTKGNWRWLRDLAYELNDEYKYRFDNDDDHKSAVVISNLPEPNIEGSFTEPPRAMPDYCKKGLDSVNAYRKYYREEKDHLAEWTRRPVPKWFTQSS
jgi:hypothetical protein